MSTTVLEIKGLSKKYKDVQALNKLNLSVQSGQIFGILGPNGSGKTTTLGILTGVINATEGTYSWFSNGTKDINRTRIGTLLETPNFYPYLSAVQNLRIVAMIKHVKDQVDEKIEKVLKTVNLYERRNSKFKTYSLGMKQRLAIASALLNDPEVLVLDEPTNGLDPQGIAEIRELVINIAKEGKTIIIASHALDEIEKVCTDVAILKNGVLIRQSGIENILGDTRQLIVKAASMPQLEKTIGEIDGISLNELKNNKAYLNVEDHIKAEDVNKAFFDKGIVLSELLESKKSLETQFLEITKGESQTNQEEDIV